MIFRCSYCKKDFTNIKDCEDCEVSCKKLLDEKTTKENQRKEDLAKIEKMRKDLSELVNDYNKKYLTAYVFTSEGFDTQAAKILNQMFDLL